VTNEYPADLVPILEAIADRAARLCESQDARIFVVEGEVQKYVAGFGEVPFLVESTRPLTKGLVTGRAIIDRAVVHIEDITAVSENEYPEAREIQKRVGHRTLLAVPLVSEGKALGAILLRRSEVRPFDSSHIELVKSFADQAAVAIENLRLSKELRTRNAELTEALEQQTATAEILKVISSSPADIQPVFDAIAASAARLCDASEVVIRRVSDGELTLVAHLGTVGVISSALPISRTIVAGRAILERRTIHVHDVLDLRAREEYPNGGPMLFQGGAFRTLLVVPLMREDTAIGMIAIRRQEVRPFSEKQIKLLETFAAQAAIAIENVRLFNETKEALEQQTATADILKVISSSPTDTQPVFDAIVRSGMHLFRGLEVSLRLVKGDHTEMVATTMPKLGPAFPLNDSTAMSTRAILTREIIQIPDVMAEEWAGTLPRRRAEERGFRAIVFAPMIRDGNAIGVITVARTTPGLFWDKEIALLRTFSDQAVIAIENVRLFNETKEALEQQTVTSGILRVISSSPTDTQPVFDAIVKSGVHLFGGMNMSLRLIRGEHTETVASTIPPSGVDVDSAIPLNAVDSPSSEAIRRCDVVQVPDIPTSEWVGEFAKYRAARRGFRAIISAPMLREGTPIGVINVMRATPGPLTVKRVALLRTFADQAVIAIENVRLFKELQARNAEVTEALEQQTATSEILKVISSSPTDTQPVFEAIVKSGAQLFRNKAVSLRLVVGDSTEMAASTDPAPRWSIPLSDDRSVTARAIRLKTVVQVPDIFAEQWIGEDTRQRGRDRGFRAVISAPMLKEGAAIGAISVLREAPGPFAENEIALFKTFADQAVIAIENVRLFKEIQEKRRQLEIANQHKSQFLANMSHELRTPLNAVIGFSDLLLERMFGEMNAKQENYVRNIQTSGKHLLSLINDILDLSKIEAGRMELDVSSVHIPSALQNALMLIRERAERQRIQLSCEVDPRIAEIPADERKFKQIVLNLLSNAVKFTPEGGRIDVGARLLNGQLEISVKDTGMGIEKKNQPAMFEQFRQVGRQHSGKREGTGLGLALTRRFVELHGGSISLESEPGRGSTFTFTIPVRR